MFTSSKWFIFIWPLQHVKAELNWFPFFHDVKNLCYIHFTYLLFYWTNVLILPTPLPCEQRLHFRCVSCRAKSSLYRQPFKFVQKSGQINKKNSFFPVLDRFRALRESCVPDQSCRNFFIPAKLAPFDNLTINFACESRDEFRACTVENWTVVGRGYFSHARSHSENVASARRVLHPQIIAAFLFPLALLIFHDTTNLWYTFQLSAIPLN